MILGFIVGVAAGAILLTWYQSYLEEKEFEAELKDVANEMEEGDYSFSYDCLNDPDPVDEEQENKIKGILENYPDAIDEIHKHIPKI